MSNKINSPQIGEVWVSPTGVEYTVKSHRYFDGSYVVEYIESGEVYADVKYQDQLYLKSKSSSGADMNENTHLENDDKVKIGDIYDTVNPSDIFYVIKSEPFENTGECFAEMHSSNGKIYPSLFNPSNKAFKKRVVRPKFPYRNNPTIYLNSTGAISGWHSKSNIASVDYRDIPWCWPDNTPLTESERGIGS